MNIKGKLPENLTDSINGSVKIAQKEELNALSWFSSLIAANLGGKELKDLKYELQMILSSYANSQVPAQKDYLKWVDPNSEYWVVRTTAAIFAIAVIVGGVFTPFFAVIFTLCWYGGFINGGEAVLAIVPTFFSWWFLIFVAVENVRDESSLKKGGNLTTAFRLFVANVCFILSTIPIVVELGAGLRAVVLVEILIFLLFSASTLYMLKRMKYRIWDSEEIFKSHRAEAKQRLIPQLVRDLIDVSDFDGDKEELAKEILRQI